MLDDTTPSNEVAETLQEPTLTDGAAGPQVGLHTSLLQEAVFGQLARWASGGKLFPYRDEMPGFVVPLKWAAGYKSSLALKPADGDDPDAKAEDTDSPPHRTSVSTALNPSDADIEGPPTLDTAATDPYLIDWFGPDDIDNPQNWSHSLKLWITVAISALTFSVYMGAGIFTAGEVEMAEAFGVSLEAIIVGLTVFILGYGLGPMLGLTAASEVAWIGRNPPYMICLFIFVILQIPTALVNNYAGMIILRFLGGFFGGPPLATGGASMGDVWPPTRVALAIGFWSLGAVMGPTAGPLIGGFASARLGWRWVIWPLLMLSGTTLVLLFFTLPETFADNILLRRAKRMRKLTGNPHLRARCELKPHITLKEEMYETLVRPFILGTTQPIVIGLNMHIALVYALMYVFLESLPLVYVVPRPDGYGFNMGELGVVFFCLNITCWSAFGLYWIWHERHFIPTFMSYFKKGRFPPTEIWLELSIVGGLTLPAVLFFFAWTASPKIHWMVPTIAYVCLAPPIYFIFQSSFGYLAQAYPEWMASTFAANDFTRSAVGAALPLVSRQLFSNMHKWYGPRHFPVAWGATILGFIALAMAPIPILLYLYGPRLRQWSKYAATLDVNDSNDSNSDDAEKPMDEAV